jgi:hypothetical protein
MLWRHDRQPTVEKSGSGSMQAACLREQRVILSGGDAYWVRACAVSPLFVRRNTLYFQTPKRSGARRRQAVFYHPQSGLHSMSSRRHPLGMR